jgi:hypothetical protein
MTDMARYTLAWRRPDIPPPGPRVLKSILVQRGDPCPPEIMEIFVPGSGYSIGWELVTQKPIRRFSREARARIRRRNLERRIQRKFPMFAEEFIARELAARPDYFAAIDVQDLRE